jgi:hypothetical protein
VASNSTGNKVNFFSCFQDLGAMFFINDSHVMFSDIPNSPAIPHTNPSVFEWHFDWDPAQNYSVLVNSMARIKFGNQEHVFTAQMHGLGAMSITALTSVGSVRMTQFHALQNKELRGLLNEKVVSTTTSISTTTAPAVIDTTHAPIEVEFPVEWIASVNSLPSSFDFYVLSFFFSFLLVDFEIWNSSDRFFLTSSFFSSFVIQFLFSTVSNCPKDCLECTNGMCVLNTTSTHICPSDVPCLIRCGSEESMCATRTFECSSGGCQLDCNDPFEPQNSCYVRFEFSFSLLVSQGVSLACSQDASCDFRCTANSQTEFGLYPLPLHPFASVFCEKDAPNTLCPSTGLQNSCIFGRFIRSSFVSFLCFFFLYFKKTHSLGINPLPSCLSINTFISIPSDVPKNR